MEALSGIVGALGKFGGALGGATSAISPITSLFGLVNQFSQAQKAKGVEDRAIWYSKHPEAVSNMVAAATKPLSSGLTSSVSNVVNANLAEQGLSQAPGIQTQNLAQALAPYQQNEQQMAMEQVFKVLGLPTEALRAMNLTPQPNLAAMLAGSGSQPSPWTGGMVGNTPDNALATPSYMPTAPFGVYGPDVAPPDDIGTTASGGINLGNIFGG